MANRLLFTLLSFVLQFAYAPVWAANMPATTENIKLQIDYCDAPAPENFQVTSIFSDLVSLSWVPAWVGATQALELSVESSGNWVVLLSDNNVPGDSYSLENLDPGYYRARIATNCATGETSSVASEILFKFKIIDLSTAGRVPRDPVEVADCEKIDYLNHEWVGFSVTEIATGISNLFEFTYSEGENPMIKRVLYDHPIVAVDKLGIFPNEISPLLDTPTPFQLDDLNDGNSNNLVIIGYVDCINNNTFPSTITLCKDEVDPPVDWKTEYTFAALTAESVVGDPYIKDGSTENSSRDSTDYSKFKAQSPFKENLNLFVPKMVSGCNKATVHLLNTNGQKLLTYKFGLDISQISIPAASLLPGIYILQFETDCEIQTVKVVKSE